MTEETGMASTEMTQPVIIDLGKQRARSLKDLKKGEGKLWAEVLEVVDEVKDMLGAEADGKVLVPIVMLYQQRSTSRRLDLDKILFPLLDDDEDDKDEDEDEEES